MTEQPELFGNNEQVSEVQTPIADCATVKPYAVAPVVADVPKAAAEPEQPALFDKGEWWHEHWKGMPEYISEDLTPLRTIYVHFEKLEDVDAFSKLINQRIGPKVQSIWYPEAEIGRFADKRYIDALPKEIIDSEDMDGE